MFTPQLRMESRAIQKLSEIATWPLFQNVGKPTDLDVISVSKWKDAARLCAAPIWSSVQLQISNYLVREINTRNYERFAKWNDNTEQLRPKLAELVTSESLAGLTDPGSIPEVIGSAKWDLLMLCLSAEYADVLTPVFFITELEPIYRAGHFPCGWTGPAITEGWRGAIPDHKLYVY